jgi:hypothetical protein
MPSDVAWVTPELSKIVWARELVREFGDRLRKDDDKEWLHDQVGTFFH